jgi:serine protease DegQ
MILVPAGGVVGATSLLVTLADGDLYVGDLVGADTTSGLAIVHINGTTGLATVVLSTDPISQGSFALALTRPGGTSFSLGTVRSLYSSPRVDGHRLVGEITTDLGPSSGPPGSPLLGSSGAVEGIVNGATKSGAVVAPSWLAAVVADELIATGKVSHGWLGLKGTTSAGDPAGVLVKGVASKSAVAQAGIRAGDVIVSLDHMPVSSFAQLQARLYALPPDTRVTIGVVRDAVRSTHSVVLGTTPNT